MASHPNLLQRLITSGNTDVRNGSRLAQVNQRILAAGEQLPAVTLRDVSKVQTGTVATVLHNVARCKAGKRGEVERELELSVQTRIQVGLLSCFLWKSG